MGIFSRLGDGRMIFESIETRILVGVTMFVATMILVGWVAINENARMAAFDQQHLARSIERGALLFNNNCATCHGSDGLGIAGRAPALNNPQLFGWTPFPDQYDEIAALQAELDPTSATPATPERRAEIEARLAELQPEVSPFETSVISAIQRGYNPVGYNRLTNVGWGGGLSNYVLTTLIHGRPVSANYWPQAMPAWSQTAGGPLRMDQLQDLTNFILNWNRDFTIDDLLAVNQFAIEPVDPRTATGSGVEVVSTIGDLEEINTALSEVTGDPNIGQALYNGQQATESVYVLACSTCHLGGAQAPSTEGTWTRVINDRLPAIGAQFGLETGEEYLIHSILAPQEYTAPPGNWSAQMPNNYATQLTIQELADLVAYLRSQDQ